MGSRSPWRRPPEGAASRRRDRRGERPPGGVCGRGTGPSRLFQRAFPRPGEPPAPLGPGEPLGARCPSRSFAGRLLGTERHVLAAGPGCLAGGARPGCVPTRAGGRRGKRQPVCSAPATLPAPGTNRHRFLPPPFCGARTALRLLAFVRPRVRSPSSFTPPLPKSLGSLIDPQLQAQVAQGLEKLAGEGGCPCGARGCSRIPTAELPPCSALRGGCPCVAPSVGQAGVTVDFAKAWPGVIAQIFALLTKVHVPACASRMWLWSSIPSKGSAGSLREQAQNPFAEMPPQHVNWIPHFCHRSSFTHECGVGRLWHM